MTGVPENSIRGTKIIRTHFVGWLAIYECCEYGTFLFCLDIADTVVALYLYLVVVVLTVMVNKDEYIEEKNSKQLECMNFLSQGFQKRLNDIRGL